ncbi:MAG: Bifunctional protein GlmU [bacterium ADurb.Bin425]|nr:MAG: Bifunctional protein GlmU [bacterium ADurb.Bin425]
MKYLRDIKLSRLSLESGVTIIDPQSTWISPEVRIGQETLVMPGCIILGDVEIGSGCQIGPYSVIKGRVRIGDGTSVNHSHVNDSVIGAKAKIGPFAHLREGNSVGDASKVGNFVELKKTTVGEHTNVSHLSYVGDAALGNNVNIGAGTITANYDHITKKKERTILGDGASTGSNSVLVAPVELEAEAVVGAGSVVTKNVPSGALAVARSRQENIEGWAKKRKAKVKTS